MPHKELASRRKSVGKKYSRLRELQGYFTQLLYSIFYFLIQLPLHLGVKILQTPFEALPHHQSLQAQRHQYQYLQPS